MSVSLRVSRNTFLSKFAIVFAISLSVQTGLWAQAAASLRGNVTDPSGAGIPKATVTIRNPAVNIERSIATGPQGDYSFLALPPGTYNLTVTSSGFDRYEQANLQLLVNTPATVNVQLKLGSVNETLRLRRRHRC